MVRDLRLEKNDCDDIGFVKACLVAGVIDFEEFKKWIYHVIENQNEVPSYFWDILDLKNKFDFKPISIMGFIPYWEHDEGEGNALDGIGYRRKTDFSSDVVSREQATKSLEKNMHIEQRFRDTFPFIDL
ncbi:hypothetical protein [Algihabitans sp.]|uniref:hypothetical protein n=1 Tax=Algihabitans sp. TaxID=2821514 RepID=UPI003BAD2031